MRSGTCRGTLVEVRMGRGTFGKVRDGSGDPTGGTGRVGGHSGRSGTGRGTHPEVLDRSGDTREGK